jgi:hypothetical protein
VRLLLDVHVLLWFAAGDEQLGRKARAVIADPDNMVLASVSLQEVAIKVRIGKLEVDLPALVRESVRAGFDTFRSARQPSPQAAASYRPSGVTCGFKPAAPCPRPNTLADHCT